MELPEKKARARAISWDSAVVDGMSHLPCMDPGHQKEGILGLKGPGLDEDVQLPCPIQIHMKSSRNHMD